MFVQVKRAVSPGTPQSAARLQRVPAFDGIRAVAVLGVLLYHMGCGNGSRLLRAVAARGWYGVDVFFVLSGFLITRLLVDELDNSGSINLRRFYARRCFRLYPAFLSAIILTFIVTAAFGPRVDLKNFASMIPYYVTYTFNIWMAFNWWGRGGMQQHLPLTQIWTLCIEEQFYLAWPLILRALGRKAAVRALYCAVAGSIVLRSLIYVFVSSWRAQAFIGFFTLTKLDTIGIGCILALTVEQLAPLSRLYSTRALWLYILCAMPLLWWGTGQWYFTVGSCVVALSVAVIIAALWMGGSCALTRVLASKPMVEIGKVSYGMYLFQFFTISAARHLIRETSSWACLLSWVIAAALLIGLAEIHFQTVETYFLSLRDRIFDEDGRLQSAVTDWSSKVRTATAAKR